MCRRRLLRGPPAVFTSMYEGTIKTIKSDKGYGFISRIDAPDIFFHASCLDGLEFDEQLIERRVRFDIVGTDKGDRAVNVRPAD